MGWDALFFGQVASFHPVIASQPDGVTDGFYTFAQFDTPSRENCDEWVCNWIDKYEGIYGNSPNIGSAYGYMYADITAKAIEIAGRDLNVDTFTGGLESIDNYEMPFGDSVLSWGPDKHLGSSDAYLFVVEGGRFVRADSMKYEY